MDCRLYRFDITDILRVFKEGFNVQRDGTILDEANLRVLADSLQLPISHSLSELRTKGSIDFNIWTYIDELKNRFGLESLRIGTD